MFPSLIFSIPLSRKADTNRAGAILKSNFSANAAAKCVSVTSVNDSQSTLFVKATSVKIFHEWQRIGIERGKSFDIDKLDPAIKTALETAPKDALALMAWKVNSMARVVNGWSMNTDTMGVYGNYYLKRAIVTEGGLR